MSLSFMSFMKAVLVTAALTKTLLMTCTSADETFRINKNISCRKQRQSNELKCKLDSSNPIGSISFNRTLENIGWDTITIKVNPDNKYLSPKEEMFAIGWAEGFVTIQSISDNYDNTMGGMTITKDERKWIDEHIKHMNSTAEGDDPYSLQLAGILEQLKGIASGYKDGCKITEEFKCTELDFFDIFLLNFQSEVWDVQTALGHAPQNRELSVNNRDQSSALIKPAKDDIFVSHATWSGFATMYRQYKTYNLGSKFVTMSGYPGIIHSLDDWYMTGGRLAVMGTANRVYDDSLFIKYLKDNTTVVSSFIRTMIANYVAQTPKEWVELWSLNLSWTRNSQWMVFDMKQYTPNEKSPKGSFYIVETVPGAINSGDVSDVLNEQEYWASYNIPYFKEIRDLSGVTRLEEVNGDFFSYTKNARARIFSRDHSAVTNITSMMDLMRYNDYVHDNLSLISNCKAATDSKCKPPYSAMLAIAARGDLNPAVTPSDTSPEAMYGVNWKYLFQRPHCAIDAKIASYRGMIRQEEADTDAFSAVVISGPTTLNELPPFDHANSPFSKEEWKGLPIGKWEFPVLEIYVYVPLFNRDDIPRDIMSICIGIGVAGGLIFSAAIFILCRFSS